MFPTYDEVYQLMNALLDEIPEPFFKELSGGVILLEGDKHSPYEMDGRPLYIMGEYVRSSLGKQIILYYGSFNAVYSHLSVEKLRDKLRKTLIHEFVHHLEGMAGKRDLEKQDETQLNRYIKKG